ncbi:hypothetical protein Pan44_24210 [Caulifigura coniformis]|uniref:Uncharacterized protein n=1 Tax=Caulifigura coniformis TaxID=2527983 RepID=A0A517SE47_9PLAN|nr:hypothetical protein Pan44_24210 [Caulifigura coniformis]
MNTTTINLSSPPAPCPHHRRSPDPSAGKEGEEYRTTHTTRPPRPLGTLPSHFTRQKHVRSICASWNRRKNGVFKPVLDLVVRLWIAFCSDPGTCP